MHTIKTIYYFVRSAIRRVYLRRFKPVPSYCRPPNDIGIDVAKKSEGNIIVSVTSYPARMHAIHYTIASLLNQTLKPNAVVLWLGTDKFPNKEADLPASLLSLRSKGLTISWCEDMRSFTKIIPSLCVYPHDIIVTADDDIFYPRDWLERLVRSYTEHPDDIHCHRVHRILFSGDGSLLSYLKWNYESKLPGRSYLNFLTGVGGVLYPPGAFCEEVLKVDKFMNLCKYADDIWLWAMAVKSERKIRLIENAHSRCLVNYKMESPALCDENNGVQNRNDVQLNAVLAAYPEVLGKIKDEFFQK